jgi:SAM-dependent methyltransferase
MLHTCLESNGHSAKNVLLGDFLDADCAPLRESCDLLVSFGVIEHFDDAWGILDKWKCVLKKGGIVVTSVPNMHSINAAPFRWLDRAYWRQHVAYTPEAMDSLHTKAGLDVVQKADYVGKYSLDMLTPWDVIARRFRNRYLFKVVHTLARLCVEKPLGLFPGRGVRRLSPHVMGVYSFGHESAP